MRKIICTYCFLVLLAANQLLAQHKSTLVKIAEIAYSDGNFYHSIDLYNEELKKNKSNAYALQQLGLCYQKIGDFTAANTCFKKLYASNDKDCPLAEYYLAMSQKTLGEYAVAKEHFDNVKKTYKGNNQSYYTAKAKDESKICTIALSATERANVFINLLPPSVNKRYSELSPTVFNNMLVFSALSSDTLLSIDEEAPTPKSKFYYIELNDSSASPKLFLPQFFNEYKHDLVDIDFSTDAQRMYFTLCQKNSDGKEIAQIYGSAKEGVNWGKAVKMGDLINDPSGLYTAIHPALGWDSKSKQDILYFSSDRPGGSGALDLWYAEIDAQFSVDGVYNMGRKFNSVENEITPFIDSQTGHLYFSSNGLDGLGGYDIFIASDKGKNFDKPKNMGKPYNSSYDDFYFRHSAKQNGYFVSNRINVQKSNCCDDIFSFRKEDKKHFNFSAIKKVNDSTEQNINSVSFVFFHDKDTVMAQYGKTYSLPTTDSITVLALKNGYIQNYRSIALRSLKNDTSLLVMEMEEIKLNQEYRLNNIFFDYDKATLTSACIGELERLRNFISENPDVLIEIAAHSDNKGAADYNLKLSQARAKSVVDYLVQKGIPQEQLVAKGYGMTVPIAFNTTPTGEDNPEGRQLNRRIVFKIIGPFKTEQDEK